MTSLGGWVDKHSVKAEAPQPPQDFPDNIPKTGSPTPPNSPYN
jgi:hypothetical protein